MKTITIICDGCGDDISPHGISEEKSNKLVHWCFACEQRFKEIDAAVADLVKEIQGGKRDTFLLHLLNRIECNVPGFVKNVGLVLEWSRENDTKTGGLYGE